MVTLWLYSAQVAAQDLNTKAQSTHWQLSGTTSQRRNKMSNAPIEARKDGIVYCVYSDVSTLPDKEMMKHMKAAGYKFYQDGKIYKSEK